MPRSGKSGGSSPSGPVITRKDRLKLADLDSEIQKRDNQLKWISKRSTAYKKLAAKRKDLDEQRRVLRLWMKGYGGPVSPAASYKGGHVGSTPTRNT